MPVRRIAAKRRPMKIPHFLFSAFLAFAAPALADKPKGHVPGPHVVPIDYAVLYAMKKPPEYKPFAFYGDFLMHVAVQQTPMVYDPFMAIPDDVEKFQDVVFKEVDGKALAMDIYRPKGDATPNPLVLIFHGGYWKAGDKATHQFHAVEFAHMGYTAASVSYRLSGDAPYPANVEDLYDAVRFLTKNATTYSIDPSRIAAWGGSAGGHLASLVGLAANTKGYAPATGIDAAAFKAIISIYGVNDLTLPIQRMNRSTEQYIGASWETAAKTYAEASPVNHVDADDPPVLLTHGTIDGSVSVLNSDSLHAKLKKTGVPVVYDRVEGWPHIMDFFSPIGERTLWVEYQFLRKHMPSDEMRVVK